MGESTKYKVTRESTKFIFYHATEIPYEREYKVHYTGAQRVGMARILILADWRSVYINQEWGMLR